MTINLAKRYQRKGLELLELIQEGTIGLSRAVQQVDPSRGHRCRASLYSWIRQDLSLALFSQGCTIGIPVIVNGKLMRLPAAKARHLQTHGVGGA